MVSLFCNIVRINIIMNQFKYKYFRWDNISFTKKKMVSCHMSGSHAHVNYVFSVWKRAHNVLPHAALQMTISERPTNLLEET